VNAIHRQTAADWHRGETTPALYAYAATGAVEAGLAGEIEDLLATIERAQPGGTLDPVGEHQRLRALLHHAEPKVVALSSYDVGRHDGRSAATRWDYDTFDDRPASETMAVARRILDAVEAGDPRSVELDLGWDEIASPAEIAARSGWIAPSIDDVVAYKRWETAQPDIYDAYVAGFADAFWDVAVVACRRELVDASPHIRPVGSVTIPDPAGGEMPVPSGWVAESIGLWDRARSDVIYNPRRLKVDLLDGNATEAMVGWQIAEPGGSKVLWIRDRDAATRAALDRLDHRIAQARASGPAPTDEPPTPGVEL
jgi:hypothetical protein